MPEPEITYQSVHDVWKAPPEFQVMYEPGSRFNIETGDGVQEYVLTHEGTLMLRSEYEFRRSLEKARAELTIDGLVIGLGFPETGSGNRQERRAKAKASRLGRPVRPAPSRDESWRTDRFKKSKARW